MTHHELTAALHSATYRKSTRSNGTGNCVEVGFGPGAVGARDSKLGDDGPVLAVPAAAWTSFVGAVKIGTFDR